MQKGKQGYLQNLDFFEAPLKRIQSNKTDTIFLKLTAVYFMILFSTAEAASDYQEKLETLRQRINTIQSDLAADEKTKQITADALQDTERSISNIYRKLMELKNRKQIIDGKLKHVLKQQKQLITELEIERNQLSTLVRQQYMGDQQNYLRTLLNQQNPNQTARDMFYYRQLTKSRTESIHGLQDRLIQLQDLAQSVRVNREKTATIQAEYIRQSDKLRQEKRKHSTILARLATDIAQQQNQINKLKQDESRITKLVSEINKIYKQKDDKDDKDANYNTLLPATDHKNTAFLELKGKLNLPVRGKLVNRFGKQRSGNHVTWKGLFISSPGGSDVKTIATGRVVFADWLRGFGNLIIIDHSHDYMSLYGNNESLLKRVGDVVQSGETIAIVGNSGGNPDPGLYFELRHKGKAFDPLTWIKIE